MKFGRVLFTLFVLIVSVSNIMAQVPDTVTVDPSIVNSLADATEDAANIGKVFKLVRGAVYLNDRFFTPIDTTTFELIGEAEPSELPPASIRRSADPGGVNWAVLMSLYAKNVKLENVAFNGFTLLGEEHQAAVSIATTGSKVMINKCLFQGGQWGLLWLDSNPDEITVTNSIFTNTFTPRNGWIQGAPLSSWGAGAVKVKFENNTVLWIGSVVQVVAADSVFYDHNTLAYVNRAPFFPASIKNQVVQNNILYDVAMKGFVGERILANGDTLYKGDWSDDQDLDSLVGVINVKTDIADTSGQLLDNNDRIYRFDNNLRFTSQRIKDLHALVGAVEEPLMNARTTTEMATFAKMGYENNIDETLDPDFVMGIPDSLYDNFYGLMQAKRDELTERVAPLCEWNFNGDQGSLGDINVWPLPIDLRPQAIGAYDVSTDGYPLGDLNWIGEEVVDDWEAGLPYRYTGVEENTTQPVKFALAQNYPNPFNPSTSISYEISKPANISIIVYNINGQKVKTLVSNKQTAGINSVTWNATNDFGEKVVSGVYFYQLKVDNDIVATRKMMLIK